MAPARSSLRIKVKCPDVLANNKAKERRLRFIERLQQDPYKWKAFKERDAERSRAYRKKKKTNEQIERIKELSKIRCRNYRSRQKEKIACGEITMPKPNKARSKKIETRAEINKKREKWREYKRKQRANLTIQKQRRNKERNSVRRSSARECAKSKQLKNSSPIVDAQTPQDKPSTSPGYTSNSAKCKALKRIKFPKDPIKLATIIGSVIQTATPRKQQAFSTAGISCTQNPVERNIEVSKIVVQSIKELSQTIHKKHNEKKSLSRMFTSNLVKKLKQQSISNRYASKLLKIRPAYMSKSSQNQDLKLRKTHLSDHVKNLVLNFYTNRLDVAIEEPNKKNVKKLECRKFLLKPIRQHFNDWKTENPNEILSFSKFAKLRPKNILTFGKTRSIQCVCEYCANIEIKLKTLKKISDKKEININFILNKFTIVNMSMCSKKNALYPCRACIFRECENCGTSTVFKILQLLSHPSDNSFCGKWEKWENVKTEFIDTKGILKTISKKELVTKSGNVDQLINELICELEPFAKHLFVADWQHKQFVKISSNVPDGCVVTIMDFAENFTCHYQDEAQSVYYAKQQVTLFPVATFYRCLKDGNIVKEMVDIISEDLRHDSHAVSTFTKLISDHLQLTRNLIIKQQIQFTDGCGEQFKSRRPLADISFCHEDLGYDLQRLYFGSRHGKSACDGEGGVIKHSADLHIKSRQVVIRNAKEFFDFCQNTLLIRAEDEFGNCQHFRRHFLFVSRETINRNRPDREVKAALPKTRQLHAVQGIKPGIIKTRVLGCCCNGCIIGQVCENQEYVGNWSRRILKMDNLQKCKVLKERTDIFPNTKNTKKSKTNTESPSLFVDNPLEDIRNNVIKHSSMVLPLPTTSKTNLFMLPTNSKEVTKNLIECPAVPVPKVKMIGRYVAVMYDDSWYPGQVDNVVDDQLFVNFMCRVSNGRDIFTWPPNKDIQPIYINGILAWMNENPQPVNNREHYQFSQSILNTIEKIIAGVF